VQCLNFGPLDDGGKASVIVRKDGDENSARFWNLFASGDAGRAVDGKRRFFVVRTIVSETIGAHRCGN
jgi:hypothetical protein